MWVLWQVTLATLRPGQEDKSETSKGSEPDRRGDARDIGPPAFAVRAHGQDIRLHPVERQGLENADSDTTSLP
jgi:hypothetical protein